MRSAYICACVEKHTHIQQKMLSSFPIVVQVLSGRNNLVHKEERTVICGNIFSLVPVYELDGITFVHMDRSRPFLWRIRAFVGFGRGFQRRYTTAAGSLIWWTIFLRWRSWPGDCGTWGWSSLEFILEYALRSPNSQWQILVNLTYGSLLTLLQIVNYQLLGAPYCLLLQPSSAEIRLTVLSCNPQPRSVMDHCTWHTLSKSTYIWEQKKLLK